MNAKAEQLTEASIEERIESFVRGLARLTDLPTEPRKIQLEVESRFYQRLPIAGRPRPSPLSGSRAWLLD